MKKVFTLLAAIGLSLSLFAFDGPTKLSISSTGNMNIRVVVDGNKYKTSGNSVLITSLTEGYHSIKIFQLKNNRNWNRDNRGVERDKDNGIYSYQLIYSGNITLRSQFFLDMVINRFGKVFTDEQPMNSGNYYDEDDDWDNNINNNNNNGYNNNNGNGYNNIQAMDAVTFEKFKRTLKNENFDAARLDVAKQGVAANYFTSSQVREILMLFSFDDSKLELAKFAYKYTIDKGSYFLLNDVFDFGPNKEELSRYVQAYK